MLILGVRCMNRSIFLPGKVSVCCLLGTLLISACTSLPPEPPLPAVEAPPPALPEGWRQDPDPERYEGPVVDAENQYAPGTLPEKPIVFVGSSTFTNWKALEGLWPGYRVLNRGFGGSHMSDVLFYFDRMVKANAPRQVFVYEGDNDIDVGKPVDQVLAHFRQFGRLMKEALPGVPVVFLAVKPSPARWAKAGSYRKFNADLKAWAEEQGWSFIDTWTPMLGEDGKPDPNFYEADRLHLSSKGYDRWIPLLRPALKAP